MQILVFSDSISFGPCDKEGGWVSHLRRYFDQGLFAGLDLEGYVPVISLCVKGNSTASLLQRLDRQLSSRFSSENPTMVILQLGTNDCVPHSGIDENRFSNNLATLIRIIRRYSGRVILTGIPPICIDKTDPFTEEKDPKKDGKRAILCNDIIYAESGKEKLLFMDLRKVFLLKNGDLETLFFDLIHPNEDGYAPITSSVLQAVLAEHKINGKQ